MFWFSLSFFEIMTFEEFLFFSDWSVQWSSQHESFSHQEPLANLIVEVSSCSSSCIFSTKESSMISALNCTFLWPLFGMPKKLVHQMMSSRTSSNVFCPSANHQWLVSPSFAANRTEPIKECFFPSRKNLSMNIYRQLTWPTVCAAEFVGHNRDFSRRSSDCWKTETSPNRQVIRINPIFNNPKTNKFS